MHICNVSHCSIETSVLEEQERIWAIKSNQFLITSFSWGDHPIVLGTCLCNAILIINTLKNQWHVKGQVAEGQVAFYSFSIYLLIITINQGAIWGNAFITGTAIAVFNSNTWSGASQLSNFTMTVI